MDDITARRAQVNTNDALQRLILLLEEKGTLSHDETVYVFDEGPKPPNPLLGTTSEDW